MNLNPRKVFVWVEYNTINVYDTNTTEQALVLFEKIKKITLGWIAIDNSIVAEIEIKVNKANVDVSTVRQQINLLLDEIIIGSTPHFESGTGFTNLR